MRETAGFAEVNKQVVGIMREWMAQSGKEALTNIPVEDRPTSALIGFLARLLAAQGKYGEAEPLFKEALDGYRRTLGDNHDETMGSLAVLAWNHYRQEKFINSEEEFLELLPRRKQVLGSTHPRTLLTVAGLGLVRHAQGDKEQAKSLLNEVRVPNSLKHKHKHKNTKKQKKTKKNKKKQKKTKKKTKKTKNKTK